MERAFISGRGLITPIGKTVQENIAGLRSGRSGIIREPSFVEHKLESQVGGSIGEIPSCPLIDRKTLRFCPPVGVMSVVAVLEAIAEAGITLEELRSMRVAIIGGVAGGNYRELYEETASYMNANYRLRNVSPYCVPRIMPSNAVASLSLLLGLTGESYDVSAACASSAVSVMVATRLIRSGQYDVVIAGGAEKLDWVEALGFTACRALSRKFNDTPEKASRPFDRDRDGFVLAEGAAYVVLESESHLKARGGRAISEVSGIAANSNAKDMVVPDTAASANVMRNAIADAGLRPEEVGYVNTHGTGTPVGDPVELAAIREVLGTGVAINSTKSQTGHMVGATGAAEIIFTSLMLEHKFISPSINLDNPDPEFAWADLVRECRDGVDIRHGISNSFAFGGSNVAVVISDCGK
ncbi:beta-ketoacyl synthase [uncultured Victivallis sp.]|uniref:beta-ketoacyl-[acyl-carrier-protein] synthase family protein n=1 Tax=uncultured Victivallis sp. TaxID=354118 RepID=UPI0026005DCB|nr:beta-ketoacyl-[acyl-carrier-protein] synthase family protein [uncultured Victivallis sp.]